MRVLITGGGGNLGRVLAPTLEEAGHEPVFRVEPRGFKPLTSAVQRRILKFASVRRCSKIPANKHILS